MKLEKLKTFELKLSIFNDKKLQPDPVSKDRKSNITDKSTMQLDVNLDGNNLDMASETEEIQSPNTKK